MSDLPEHEHRYETFCADCGAQGWPEAELASLRERLAAAEAERAALSLQLQDARGDYHDERAARVQAEAALSRTRDMLIDWYSVDITDQAKVKALDNKTRAFLSDPANTPKETT